MVLLRLSRLANRQSVKAVLARSFSSPVSPHRHDMTVEQFPRGGVPGFRSFKLAMIQLHPSGIDKHATLKHAREMLLKAAAGEGEYDRPELLMLPEYFNGPIGNHAHKAFSELIPDVNAGSPIPQSELPTESYTLQMLSAVAVETGRYIIGGSMPERDPADDNRVYNTLTVWDPQGRLVTKFRKLHLYDVNIPGGIVFTESEAIGPGSKTAVVKFPFGTIALAICFDIRFPYLLHALQEQHPEICAYLLPAAFNTTTGPKAWEVLQRGRAIDHQIYVGMCSPARLPGEEYVAYGHSLVCDPEGKIISTETPEDQTECIVYSHLDPVKLASVRNGVPTLTAQRLDIYQAPKILGEKKNLYA